MHQLDTIIKMDQLYRSKTAQAIKKTVEENKILWRKQSAIDFVNLGKIEEIFKVYGYPGKSLVGEKYMNVAFMVVQHSTDNAIAKYLPLIGQAVEKGELKSSSFAIMVDRSQTDKGEKQTYGSQLAETNQGVKLRPIADEENVNVRRKKVGLLPLEEYLKGWNIVYKVPTATYKNPASIYYVAPEKQESQLELVGGMDALYRQMVYPSAAEKQKVTGKVIVELTIDAKGRPVNPLVVKSLGYGCDEEALRVTKTASFSNSSGEDREIRLTFFFPGKD